MAGMSDSSPHGPAIPESLPANVIGPHSGAGASDFAGFADEMVHVGPVRLRVRYAGTGPAVLLVHGHPRTGATWFRVAPLLLAAGYSVVCPDMRGYGRSSTPDPLPDHAQQSKRAVAEDLARLMEMLGHQRFSVAGHDRGCNVALRLALDHAERVDQLVVMDGVPTVEAVDRCNAAFATSWWHWFFLAQPQIPERIINADPDAWYHLRRQQMGELGYAEMQAAIHDPATVLAMIEDYRAGLGVDTDDGRADADAGRRVECPVLVLWSERDDMEDLYGDPLAIWRRWTRDLRGHSIDSGHHMAEENPYAVARSLIEFFGAAR